MDTYATAWPRYRLAPATGASELAISEAAFGAAERPVRVTAVLHAFLDQIGGQPATPELIWSLSIGTREWLVQQLAATCRAQPDWFSCTCPDCGEAFDLSVDLTQMPRADVGDLFPFAEVSTDQGVLQFRVPNGADELAVLRDQQDPKRRLLSRCAAQPQIVDALAPEQISTLEDALDQQCPDCADTLTTSCPACAAPIAARIDPLAFAFPNAMAVLTDVHLLGRSYQWREADILALPSQRRQAYVRMIKGPQVGAHP